MSSSENPKNFNKLLEEIKESEYEVKTLGDICKSSKNNKPSHLEVEDYLPAVLASDIFESNIELKYTNSTLKKNAMKTKIYIEENDLLFLDSGYGPERWRGSCIYTGKDNPIAGFHVCVLKHQQNPKYIAHFLTSPSAKNQINYLFKKRMPKIYDLHLKDIKKIKIPLPSQELQEKISHFLSDFSEYEEKLKREQKVRRKQFHYFKEQIFSELVERCRLRD